MKSCFFILIISLILSGKAFYAQRHVEDRDPEGPRKRIEELEKIKLIDVLNLDEKTMLQFFSRRKEFTDNLQKLEDEKNDKLDRIQELIDNNSGSDQDYKKIITDILNIDNRINKAREDYIASLDGLLTNEQRAKVMLFDRNFKKEIRKIILKHRVER